jgi:hypothetical protein
MCTETQSINQRRVGGWPGSFWTARANRLRTWSFLSNASHAQHDMSSCGQKPPCCGGAHCGQRREGRLDVRALPIIYALGPHLHARLPHGQAEPYAGQVWIPPGSLRCTRLSHSETVGDTAWAGPDQSHPPHTHAAPVCLGAHEDSVRQTPGGMKLAARAGKAPVWGCARHAFCSAVGCTRRLNTRYGPPGRRHRIRKELDDATERRHDA